MKGAPSAAEVDYLERQLAKRPGAAILDVPCGAGRHSLELARRGYEVTGVDISRESIGAARAAAEISGLKIDFRVGDMRSLAGLFDGSFCWGNSFGYMPHAETKRFLASLVSVLKPGASFVLQLGCVAESLLPHYQKEMFYNVGGIDFQLRHTYEVERSALQTEYKFTRNGKTETKVGWQSIYTSGELCRLLADVGLNVVHMHQNTEGQPYELGSRALILTAQRAG